MSIQIICPISGLAIYKAPYMLGFSSLREVHPIFRMKRKDLITDKIIYRFSQATALEEKRLYFLGVLHSTDLVTFETAATPSLSTCERHFLSAIDIAGWMDYAIYQVPKGLSFPRYIVREDNKEMETIGSFISALKDIREDFVKKNRDKDIIKRIEVEHQKLFNELSKAFEKDRVFTPFVARWALEFTGLHKHPQAETFYQMLTTKIEDAYGLDRDMLHSLHDMMEIEFDMNHPFYAPFFGQLRQLIEAQKRSISNLEISSMYEIIEEIEDGERVERKIDIAEAMKEKMLKTYGSTEEPKREMFKTKWEYLQAMARWEISQKTSSSKKKEEEDVSNI